MSVNRTSELGTSLSRTDGVHVSYLNLSSADRDKSVYPSSDDAELQFDIQSNVIGLEVLNFEIPHTRYAIDKSNNTLYISEKRATDEYYYYGLKASTSGYTIQNLVVSLELSSRCPVMYNGDKPLGNSYNIVSAGIFGKVGVISSGNYEYSIHCATESVVLAEFTKNSDTEAIVKFLASSDYLYAPGALLQFKPYKYGDREVQVMETTGGRSVRLLGDFSDIDSTLEVSKSNMVPYSSNNTVAKVIGMGDNDKTGHSTFEVLSMGSPFSGTDVLENASVMVNLDSPCFASPDDFVKLTGTNSFMNNTIFQIGTTHDDSHIEILVNRDDLFITTSGGTVSSDSDSFGVTSITVSAINENVVNIVLTPNSTTNFAVGDTVELNGYDAEELEGLSMSVLSFSSSSNDVTLQFTYPTTYLLSSHGNTRIAPVNNGTTILTTYVTPFRFDLSRGRRMVLCRAIIDNQDVGSIHIPSLSTTNFFARIQLFSGADLVNFLGPDTAVGTHEFNSVVKRLNKIRFQFVNEDGEPYDFVGVDYTIFIRVLKLDSNKGI